MEKEYEKFFYKDEVAMVCSKTGLVKYGLVLSTHRSRSEKEYISYKNDNLIEVVWHLFSAEEMISDDKVMLMDRPLTPGNEVRKVSEGKTSQFGYCENVDIYATVKILNTNKIIENINTRNLTRTKLFAIDSLVFYESWLGVVNDVKYKVTFASQDGSIFTLEGPCTQDFINLSTSDIHSIDGNAFYPGQQLKMRLVTLDNAKFLTISNFMKWLWHNYEDNFSYKYRSKWVKVNVQDVTVSSLAVQWHCQTSRKTNQREEYWPETLITGVNLKKIKTIDLTDSWSIQVGNTYRYTIKDTDNLMTMKQWRSKCTTGFNTGPGTIHSKTNKDKHHSKLLGTKKPSKNTHPIALVPIKICTQNGSSINVSAGLTQRNERLLNKKFKFTLLSKKFKSKPSSSTTGNSCVLALKWNRFKRNRKWKSLIKKSKQFNMHKVKTKPNSKVVVEICHTKSIVDVIWQDGTKETGVFSTDLYPVRTVDDLEFFPGNFVTEKSPASDVYGVVESVDHAERTAQIQWFKVYPENPLLPNPIEKTYLSAYDLCVHPEFSSQPGFLVIHINNDTNPELNTLTAGQVLSVGPDGRILVMWVNGDKTKCWPQELYFVGEPINVRFGFRGEQYDDEGDDAPFAEDDLSEDWVSVTSDGSSNCDQDRDVQKFAKRLIRNVRKSAKNINSCLDAVQQNCDMDKILELQIALEQYSCLGFKFGLLATTSKSETEIEKWHKDLSENLTKLLVKIILRKGIEERDEGELDEEGEVSYEIKESVTQIKQSVSDFTKEAILDFEEQLRSKYGIITKHCDTKVESDDLSIEIKDVIGPTSVFPVIEPDLAESRFITLDTKPVYEVTKPEYNQSKTKPEEAGVFDVVETLMDNSHKYINDKDNLNSSLPKVIAKDIQILQNSLPAGIWVKTFENRVDLFSIMIRGPENTPYAGGLFLFDVKIPPAYPMRPPFCHYYSYCDEQLNPNLFKDGKICISLLGTWPGYGVELWSPNHSNLLQLLVSIQGLILVSEPYYNETGFDSQRGEKLAKEDSRVYNEMVLIKVVRSMTNMLNKNNSDVQNAQYFREEILEHVKTHGPKLINNIEKFIKMSEKELTEDEKLVPGYPLLPLSKGFCLSIVKALKEYKEVLMSINIMFE